VASDLPTRRRAAHAAEVAVRCRTCSDLAGRSGSANDRPGARARRGGTHELIMLMIFSISLLQASIVQSAWPLHSLREKANRGMKCGTAPRPQIWFLGAPNGRIVEHGNSNSLGHQLMQESQPLCRHSCRKKLTPVALPPGLARLATRREQRHTSLHHLSVIEPQQDMLTKRVRNLR
jgi:hypothetical protein